MMKDGDIWKFFEFVLYFYKDFKWRVFVCLGWYRDVEKKKVDWIFKGYTLEKFQNDDRKFFFCLSPFTIRDKSKD